MLMARSNNPYRNGRQYGHQRVPIAAKREPEKLDIPADKMAKGVLNHVKSLLPPGYKGDLGKSVDDQHQLRIYHPHRDVMVLCAMNSDSITLHTQVPWSHIGRGNINSDSVKLSRLDFDDHVRLIIRRIVNKVEKVRSDRTDRLRK
jgi:hypothetical protein